MATSKNVINFMEETSPNVPAKNWQFQPGNKLGKGNPHGMAVNQLRSYLFEQVENKDWDTLKRVLWEMVEQGNLKAITLILNYSIGKPKETIEVQGVTQSTEEMAKQIAGLLGLKTDSNDSSLK